MRIRRQSAPSATSLETSPIDDETARMKQYAITMAIRTICVILAFAIQPWGWHTAVLSVGAIFLPYFAVVLANQVGSTRAAPAERPEIAIEGPAREEEQPRDDVIRIEESRSDDGRTP